MDVLFYYSKSADKIAGKGVNESVTDYDLYKDLNEIKNWRKQLSNFYHSEFIYEEKTYNTVEHAFQAKKIELIDKDKAYYFCKESGNKIGLSTDGLIARKNRKIVILSEDALSNWNYIKKVIMEDILYAKFSQCVECKKILLLTKNAALFHGTRGTPNTRQIELENVRSMLL